MNKFTVLAAFALAASVVTAAPVSDSKPVLAGTAHVADLGALATASAAAGQLVGNPMIPTALVSGFQQQLARAYGPARPGASGVFLVYIDTPAFDIAATNDIPTNPTTLLHNVVVYPLAQDLAAFTNAHPSASLENGAVHLLPAPGRAADTYVVFGKDGYAAFAPTAALSRQALVDAAPVLARSLGSDIVAVRVLDRGISAYMLARDIPTNAPPAVLRMSRRQRELTDQFAALDFSFGVSSTEGLALHVALAAKPGTEFAAAFAAAPVLDKTDWASLLVPAASPIFCVNVPDRRIQKIVQHTDDGAGGLGGPLVEMIRTSHPVFADALAAQFADFVDKNASVSAVSYLAFDSNRHPVFVETSRERSPSAAFADVARVLNALMAAARKEWPAQKICVSVPSAKGSVTYRIDLGEIVAALAAEIDDAHDTNAVAAVRSKVAAFFGSALVCRLVTTKDGLAFSAAAEDAVLPVPAPAATARARLTAVLPELAQGPQPQSAGWCSVAALARPLIQNYISTLPADKAAFAAPLLATIPADPGKGIGFADWFGKDGSARAVIRVSADEIRGVSAVFGVVSGLSMGGDVSVGASASRSGGNDSDDDSSGGDHSDDDSSDDDDL